MSGEGLFWIPYSILVTLAKSSYTLFQPLSSLAKFSCVAIIEKKAPFTNSKLAFCVVSINAIRRIFAENYFLQVEVLKVSTTLCGVLTHTHVNPSIMCFQSKPKSVCYPYMFDHPTHMCLLPYSVLHSNPNVRITLKWCATYTHMCALPLWVSMSHRLKNVLKGVLCHRNNSYRTVILTAIVNHLSYVTVMEQLPTVYLCRHTGVTSCYG